MGNFRDFELRRVELIVVGASAGGVESLSQLASHLSPELGAPVLVAIHFPEGSASMLPRILERVGAVPAKHAVDGETPVGGTIYVAPPGLHLLFQDGRLELSSGPKENGNRPAIDPLFRSAASALGQKVAAVLLSGLLSDGTAGMAHVKAAGGLTMVQDPAESLFGDMARNAMSEAPVDYMGTIEELAAALNVIGSRGSPSVNSGLE